MGGRWPGPLEINGEILNNMPPPPPAKSRSTVPGSRYVASIHKQSVTYILLKPLHLTNYKTLFWKIDALLLFEQQN